ncbi:MAG TPA: hypothetical protein VMM18_00265 [Gemmatimonadaceae bacterium]|nr:hypothetical protein [Gemmatimonadaceae bacterium]
MRRPNELFVRASLVATPSLALLLLLPGVAVGQESLFERLNLDRLQLTEFGASIGPVNPSQTLPTTAYAVHADYGEVTPRWRVVFTATYWGSEFAEDVVSRFVDSLAKSIDDPTGDATIRPSRITISDIAITVDLRWSPLPRGRVRPYVGAGGGAHVINAEGPLIDGTFVERALDNITAGVAGLAGLDLTMFNRVVLGMQVRFDLLSGIRFGSLRAGVSYRFPGTPAPARS